MNFKGSLKVQMLFCVIAGTIIVASMERLIERANGQTHVGDCNGTWGPISGSTLCSIGSACAPLGTCINIDNPNFFCGPLGPYPKVKFSSVGAPGICDIPNQPYQSCSLCTQLICGVGTAYMFDGSDCIDPGCTVYRLKLNACLQ